MSETIEGGCSGAGERRVLTLKACCRRGIEKRTGFLEPDDWPAERSTVDVDAGGGAVLGTVESAPRKLNTAWHEAAHAVVGVLWGATVTEVRVDPPAQASVFAGLLRSARARIGIALAGPIGEKWGQKVVARPEDDVLAEYVELVRQDLAGKCDGCTVARWAMFITGYDAADAEVFAAIRDVEAEVIGLITSRPVTASVRRLANLLMELGVVDEDGVWSCLGEDLLSSQWPRVETETKGETQWVFLTS